MVKPHKKRRKPKARSLNLQTRPVPQSVSAETAAPKGKIRRVGARLLDSAVESALSNIWPIIFSFFGSAAMATAVAVIVYFRAPASAWLFSLLKYALAFMGGFLAFALVLLLLVLIGIRRRRTRERQRSNKYKSTVKGPFDYTAELDPAIQQFQSLLGEIGNETTRLGGRIGTIASSATRLSFSPRARQRSASKSAALLNKHCERIERAAERLSEATGVVIEVSEGLLKFAAPASQGNQPQLIGVQKSLAVMDEAADLVIQGQENMRDHAKAAYGQVSMDVHTSLNWIIAISEENIRIMQGFQREMGLRLKPALLKKLSS